MDMKYGFVVLHYNVYTETINCVDSLNNNIKDENIKIIIIDNGSKNGSGGKLKNYYCNNSKVDVIINNENLGYARGQNVGYKIAKYKYKCDFIVLLNNDTYILQSDFTQQIEKDFLEYNFYVLGPFIINKDGNTFTNPMGNDLINVKKIRYELFKNRILLFMNYINFDETFLNIKKNIIHKKDRTIISNSQYKLNVKLHGSCLIFSPLFIKYYEGLDERTYFFMEEDLLFYHMMSENRAMLFSPKIVIYHSEDQATNSIIKNEIEKRRFIYKNHIVSLKVIKKILLDAQGRR